MGRDRLSKTMYTETRWQLFFPGTVRYAHGVFEDAISLLSTKKVVPKSTYSWGSLTRAGEAFEAQHARKDIKIVVLNQK